MRWAERRLEFRGRRIVQMPLQPSGNEAGVVDWRAQVSCSPKQPLASAELAACLPRLRGLGESLLSPTLNHKWPATAQSDLASRPLYRFGLTQRCWKELVNLVVAEGQFLSVLQAN